MANVDLNKVSSVYSGPARGCMCGCKGKHSYASQHVVWASKNRGYAVTDADVSDRAVKLMVNRLNKLDPDALHQDNPSNIVSADVNGRALVAYLVP